MTSSFIYINPQGVPCVPTKEYPYSKDENVHFVAFAEAWKEIKQSAIPIREEDHKYILVHKGDLFSPINTFVPCDPYEFEVEEMIPEWAQRNESKSYYQARIIRPSEPKHCACTGVCLQLPNSICKGSEPKADPKEKELYEMISIGSGWAIQRKEDGKLICTLPHQLEYTSVAKQLVDIINERPKELYSIKPLEWRSPSPSASDKVAESIFGDYKVYQSSDYPGKWRIWHQRNTLHGAFETIELAQHASQDHFNSKLKLCLNREL